MGHIKEPKGIDFNIESDPLTDMARKEISDFIKNYKKKSAVRKAQKVAPLNKKSIQV